MRKEEDIPTIIAQFNQKYKTKNDQSNKNLNKGLNKMSHTHIGNT